MNKKQNLIAISTIAYETLKDEKNKKINEGINLPIGAIASKAIIDAYKK